MANALQGASFRSSGEDPSVSRSRFGRETRIDGAHLTPSAEAPPPAPAVDPSPSAEYTSSPSIQEADTDGSLAKWAGLLPRLRLQACQLSRLLSARQRELDQREATQNARAAELESEIRAARVWLEDLRGQFEAREAKLDARDREIQAIAARQALEAEARDAEHESIAARLESRAKEIEANHARLASAAAHWAGVLRRQEFRERELDQAQTLLEGLLRRTESYDSSARR